MELDPNNVSAQEALGDTYEQKTQYHEAIAHWNKAMTLAADEELAATLSSADAKGGFSSAVRAVANKRLERLKHRKDNNDYLPAINFARAHLRTGAKRKHSGVSKLPAKSGMCTRS